MFLLFCIFCGLEFRGGFQESSADPGEAGKGIRLVKKYLFHQKYRFFADFRPISSQKIEFELENVIFARQFPQKHHKATLYHIVSSAWVLIPMPCMPAWVLADSKISAWVLASMGISGLACVRNSV